MSKSTFFGGKIIKEPGAYSQIKSGIKNPPLNLPYGNICIIDTGSNAAFGGGAGISGELATMKESIYNFDNIDDFRSFVKGGLHWLLAEPLFKPNGLASPGVSKITYVRAATTACAEISYTFTGGGANGGEFVIKVKDEGLIGNGSATSSILRKGYAAKMTAGIKDTAKFKIDFYVGTYRGLDPENDPYEATQADSLPTLIARSVEFNNISTLITWMTNDSTFNSYFKLDSSSVAGTGAVNSADLAANVSQVLATGGTETYNSSDLDLVLDAIKEEYYTFILADQWAANAQSAANTKILAHLVNEAKFTKFMVVGGGDDKDAFTGTNSSTDTAAYYNSEKVVVVHAGIKQAIRTGSGFKDRPSIYKAAQVLGRIAGLAPQVPGTFKAIQMDGDRHIMTQKEREAALDSGVLHTTFDADFGAFIINQDINSLQTNDNIVNDNGTSYSVSLNRIIAQINAEIVINAKKQLLGQENGVNRNTLTEQDVIAWLQGFLSLRVATNQADNLILRFENITVKTVQDSYEVSYGIVPNFAINKLFFTGFVLEN